MSNPEFYIDHETRIRVLKELADDTRAILHRMDDRMDDQFKWIVGILIAAILLPISLHVMKLI